MIPEEREFVQFASGVYKGLYRAALSDVDVFLMANAAILLGARSRRLRAVGTVLGGYILVRRAEGFLGALDHKLGQIAAVMASPKTVQSISV